MIKFRINWTMIFLVYLILISSQIYGMEAELKAIDDENDYQSDESDGWPELDNNWQDEWNDVIQKEEDKPKKFLPLQILKQNVWVMILDFLGPFSPFIGTNREIYTYVTNLLKNLKIYNRISFLQLTELILCHPTNKANPNLTIHPGWYYNTSKGFLYGCYQESFTIKLPMFFIFEVEGNQQISFHISNTIFDPVADIKSSLGFFEGLKKRPQIKIETFLQDLFGDYDQKIKNSEKKVKLELQTFFDLTPDQAAVMTYCIFNIKRNQASPVDNIISSLEFFKNLDKNFQLQIITYLENIFEDYESKIRKGEKQMTSELKNFFSPDLSYGKVCSIVSHIFKLNFGNFHSDSKKEHKLIFSNDKISIEFWISKKWVSGQLKNPNRSFAQRVKWDEISRFTWIIK